MQHSNDFFCYGCKQWRSYEDWIVKQSLGDSEADYCTNCIKRPAEDQLFEFTNLINDLRDRN